MANARHAHKTKTKQKHRDTVRRLEESAAAQTERVGEPSAEAGKNFARVGSDAIQRNSDVVQAILRSGLDAATTVMGRSTDQFSRSFGLSGDETQRTKGHSTHSAASLLHFPSAVARAMTAMSHAYFAFLQRQIEHGMDHINRLPQCRTPQDFAAVQAEYFEKTIQTAMESGRRIADISANWTADAQSKWVD